MSGETCPVCRVFGIEGNRAVANDLIKFNAKLPCLSTGRCHESFASSLPQKYRNCGSFPIKPGYFQFSCDFPKSNSDSRLRKLKSFVLDAGQ